MSEECINLFDKEFKIDDIIRLLRTYMCVETIDSETFFKDGTISDAEYYKSGINADHKRILMSYIPTKTLELCSRPNCLACITVKDNRKIGYHYVLPGLVDRVYKVSAVCVFSNCFPISSLLTILGEKVLKEIAYRMSKEKEEIYIQAPIQLRSQLSILNGKDIIPL